MGCGSTYYSLDPFDNCLDAGNGCSERLCTRCPRGADCAGAYRFESKYAPVFHLHASSIKNSICTCSIAHDLSWVDAGFLERSGQKRSW